MSEGLASYIVYGREVGENGTRHLQGYAEFPKRLRLNQLRNLLPNCHIEARRGTNEEARAYCIKDGDFQEFGELHVARQGHRSDLHSLQQSLQMGASLRDVSNDHFASFVRYNRGIILYQLYNSNLERRIKSVIVYVGGTGVGKTSSVWDNLHNINDIWVYSSDGWFDGYDNHKIALFDDFSGGEFKITFLLRLLDAYPMRVRIKGGFTWWNPEEIYITSNLAIQDWYTHACPNHVEALKRRITFSYTFPN